MEHLLEDLLLHRDTCNVPVLRDENRAVVVDGGAGDVLSRLPELGIATVDDVLVTHHHRDQIQGLDRFRAAGARIWVPASERDLVGDVDSHWQGRQIAKNYNTRQDRFSRATSGPGGGPVAFDPGGVGVEGQFVSRAGPWRARRRGRG